jgi:hypothetical protein
MNYGRFVVTISSDGFPDVIVLLDATPAQVMGGHGGWTTTARQRKIALTQWQGNDPIRLAVPVIFDSSINDITKQNIAIKNLGLMALPPKGGGEPAIINIKSDSGALPDPTGKGGKQDWVIENLQWGTNVIKDPGKTRQDVVINLLEYIDADRVAFANLPSISKHHKGHKPRKGARGTKDGSQSRGANTHGWPKWYTPKPYDTLPKIAALFYHDSSKWHRIATANLIRDPRTWRAPDAATAHRHPETDKPLKIPAP